MLPLKLRALSDESDESDSDTETPRITKELLEEKALKEYREALALKQQKRYIEAKTLLLKLVNSSLLSETDGQVGYIGGRIQPSLVHLKYGCFINLGSINAEANNLQEGLEYYVKAIELDSTDINIWFKIGKIALDVHNLDLAVQAFNNGFECNDSHWPTLDSLITALFSIGDYLSCLYMIWRAFQLDADYMKGHVMKQYIYTNHASLIETFTSVYSECSFRPDLPVPFELESLILDEAFDLRSKAGAEDQFLRRPWEKSNVRGSKKQAVRFCPLKHNSWEELGTRLGELYEQIDKEKIDVTYYTPVIFVWDSSQNYVNVFDMKVDEKNVRIAEPTEPPDVNTSTIKPMVNKRRSVPNTADQHGYDKRRSSRQRGLNKKEDPSLCVALRSVIPEELLPPREVDMFKDSPDPIRWTEDTMDLLAMLDDSEEPSSDSNGELCKQFINSLSEGERNTLMSGYFGNPDREAADVRTFLSLHSGYNILNLMISYLRNLSAKWSILWPQDLKLLYTRLFTIVSSHFSAGKFSVYVHRIEDEHTSATHPVADLVRTNTMLIILFGELTLNVCIEREHFHQQELFPSLLFQDLFEADTLLNLSESDPVLYLRLKHFSYLWSLYTSGTDLTSHLEDLDSLVAALEEINFNSRVLLVNNEYMHVISKEVYASLRTVLSVTRDLQDVVILYTQHSQCDNECNKDLFIQMISHLEFSISHEDTLSLVKQLKFNSLLGSSKNNNEEEAEDIYDTVTQYNFLLKLCHEMQYNERCFKYSASYLNKLITRFKKLNVSINNSAQVNDVWIKRRSACVAGITDIICRLHYCIGQGDYTMFSTLPQDQYKQLILNLCQLVCYQIEYIQDSANASPELNSVPLDTIKQWLILYHIVKHEELQTNLNSSVDSSPEKSAPDDLYYRKSPYATRLLLIAHEYLGKRAWCSHENGLLLFKIIEVVREDYIKYNTRANHENASYIEFLQHIDQAFYCLYGHPASKQCVRNHIKQKYYLQSHNALGVAFTYERAKQIYFFYKTNTVAEFDTKSKNYSISLDVETLFRNIIREIPESDKPDKYIDVVSNGIKKNASFKEIFAGVETSLCKDLHDIYYYIADYHFKNKVFNKAIGYYLLDICVNHSRVDAWAALALCKQKEIEMCLNSGDTIGESYDITSDCLWTCNSFKIIISLNSTILPIYIEYGTFAYTIAAFCSRRIKCDSVVGSMSLEQFSSLEKLKSQLLSTTQETFLQAGSVLSRHYKYNKTENDEKWLHLYMLGKYYEKTDSADPKSCLNCYYESFELLRVQNGAQFPTKVNYSEPQTGAVESLELYYRIHATILKLIDRSGDQILDQEVRDYYLELLRKMSVSKFVFAENDPLESSGVNVTIAEDEIEDVEIMCTVQEVMNNIVKMAQMSEEQEDRDEVTSSESATSSSNSSSEDTESESESDSESSSSDDESENQTDSETQTRTLGAKETNETLGTKDETKEYVETKKRKLARVDEPKLGKKMKTALDDEGVEISRKRKNEEEPISDEKRAKTNEKTEEDLLKKEVQTSENEMVEVKVEENVAQVEDNFMEAVIEVKSERSEEIDKTSVEKDKTNNEKDRPTNVENQCVKSENEIKTEEVSETTESSDVKPLLTEPEIKSNETEAVIASREVKEPNESSATELKVEKNHSTECDNNLSIKVVESEPETEVKIESHILSMQPKRNKIFDSINLLDNINNSCDDIFENLNKISSTCDSMAQSTPSANVEDKIADILDAQVKDRVTEDVLSESEAVQEVVRENSERLVTIPANSNTLEIDVIQNANVKTDDMDLVVVEDSGDSMEDIEVLDPESGMFKSVTQKKVKNEEIDSGITNTDQEIKLSSEDENGEQKERVADTKMEVSGQNEIGQADNVDVIGQKKTGDNADSKNPDNMISEANANALGHNEEEIEDSSEEDDSGSSESDSTSSSEEEVAVVKKKIPQIRKAASHPTKLKKKTFPKNEQTRKRKEDLRKWKKDKKEIVSYCIQALEECHRRFPEHFKSLYRIGYHYFHSTSEKDVDKARTVLLGENGLFRAKKQKDSKKQKDFFKGLWRPPLQDLDRPGSFAYHMSRSIHLVIDLLSETKDARTLMDIGVALKDEPEAEKKYLRDNEREQICQDALNLSKKILQDNLQIARRQMTSRSEMKRMCLDAKDVADKYNKAWGCKDSVYSKTWLEMMKLVMTMSGDTEDAATGGTKRKSLNKSGRDEVRASEKQDRERYRMIGDNRSESRNNKSLGEKSKSLVDRERGDKVDLRKELKEVPAKKDMSAPATAHTSSFVAPASTSSLIASAANLLFGSHFLANTLPTMATANNSLPNMQTAANLSNVSPSPIPSQSSSSMSLQQKLAAKQNQSSTKIVKPLSSIQAHGVSLANRPNLSISSEPTKSSSHSGTTIRTLTEPGKLPSKLVTPTSATKTVNVTINPTAYMSKMKKDVLKQIQNPSKPKPLLNIKPLQRPSHLLENKSKPSHEPRPSSTSSTDIPGLKLPKSLSLTKVTANTTRPESPKPKPASITKVTSLTEAPKAASPKLIDRTAQMVDLTTPIPKAISIVHGKINKPKIKKLQKSAFKKSPKKMAKKQLGPKSKVDAPSTSSTSSLKNFRKSKEGKDKNPKEIIMIELD